MGSTRQLAGRRIGRPDAAASEALDRRLLNTAIELFIKQGYAATSMEQIAAVAGAGKQSVYRRYSSKEELFVAVVNELSQAFLDSEMLIGQGTADPLSILRETCWTALEQIAKPGLVSIYRILIAERLRFPSLVEHVAQTTLRPLHDMFRRLVEAGRDAGQLRGDCPVEHMHYALTGMITGWAMQQLLLGQKGLDTAEERAAFFEDAWALFLRGAAPLHGVPGRGSVD